MAAAPVENPLERLRREIQGRTRAVRAFPDANSPLPLAATHSRHIAGTRSVKRYVNMEPLAKRHRLAKQV